ncbi:hypothetical protein Clacol_006629 [Clathrus columnatus]|uniref:Serine-threonine kinase receptor-associated protein n=1 Tax=Clathrus columnatus TaxID=1419009 RepID=A0AAV5AFF3_9AGAM|nr:hypothetical protein Clacol_006629 [Clathrus columnatus]
MSLNRAVPLTCSGHTRPVVHLSFSRLDKDGTYLLVSSCKDGNPMLREWTGDWIGTFIGHKGAVWCTKLSIDSSKAATGSADFTAKIWDTFSGAVLQSFPHNHIVRSVAFSPSTSHLMTGGQEKKVRIFDLRKPDAEPDFLGADTAHDGTVKSVVWIDDWNTVTAAEDGTVKWWDVRTRFPTSTLTFPAPITSMELSTGTSTLVLTSGQTVAFLPSLPSSKPSHNVTLPYAPSSASLHPILADRFVAGSTTDQWVRIHGMNGEEREVHKGHHGPVHCVEYSPDGEMYASGSEDGTIRLWQTTPGKSYGLWQGANGL